MTGVAEGTIFYHFKTKEGLFLAILEKLRQTLIGSFEAFFPKNRSPAAWRRSRAASFTIYTWWVPAKSCF
jgi:AcrR family transcriptional regulator